MGKTLLYHPVSLQIIRGSARQEGFLYGRITQQLADIQGGYAEYVAELIGMPEFAYPVTLPKLQELLNECYSADVQVTNIWLTKRGKVYVELVSNIDRQTVKEQVEELQ